MSADSSERLSRFLEAFYARLFHWTYRYQDRTWDYRRFGPAPGMTWLQRIKHRAKVYAGTKGWAARRFDPATASRELAGLARDQESYARAYALLSDNYSRQTFIDLLAFRALGSQHVRLPANTPEYWRQYDNDEALCQQKNVATTATGVALNRYAVDGNTGALTLYMGAGSYQYYFVDRCYRYKKEGQTIDVRSGDVVIDGGGCWGETAVLFADGAAPSGRVYTFEFNPDNTRILKMNRDANPRLAGSIELVERAMGAVSGEMLTYWARGPGTRIVAGDKTKPEMPRVETLNIDDLVAERELARVDFIKMDIEGCELDALRGAEKTIRRFKPRLAISLYHKPEDMFTIPIHIAGLGLGYKLYLDHYTVHKEETVLFGVCEDY